jgi:cell division transport system permease protein
MWSRITYTLRETRSNFGRNVTLTAAAIITAAVSLLLVGLTLLMQKGFDNLLVLWQDDVEMVVYVQGQATDAQRGVIESSLDAQHGTAIERFEYCDKACALEVADRVLAGKPDLRQNLTDEEIPTFFRVVPSDSSGPDVLRALRDDLVGQPNVYTVDLAEDQVELISKLKSFFGTYSVALSISLLLAAVLLIWNTIRTAMYARRREIEVMKLVGATDWFIRVPFMLEGLLHGLLGGVVASAGMWFINNQWTDDVSEFPDNAGGFNAMVVDSGFVGSRMLILIAVGMLVGAIGSGIAVSRFLDV